MNESPQVVVFDSSIPVQLAFYALVEHGESLKISRSKSCRGNLTCMGRAAYIER